MVPIALGVGWIRASLAHGHWVIGGLITSTFLSLLVIPVVFTYVDDLINWSLKWTRKAPRQPTHQGAQKRQSGIQLFSRIPMVPVLRDAAI